MERVWSWLGRLAGAQEMGLVIVILILGTILTVFSGTIETPRPEEGYVEVKNKFLNVDRLLTLAKNTSYIAIPAIGATIVIITAGIDLSVAGIYVLSGLAGAAILRFLGPTFVASDWSPALASLHGVADALPAVATILFVVAVCLLIGAVCGAINGLGIVLLKLHPFIITLGTAGIFGGIAYVTTRAQTITGFAPAFVESFISYRVQIGATAAEVVYPVPLVILLLATIWGTWFLGTTIRGRQLYAVGGNEQAARYSGLPVDRIKVMAYVLAGVTAAVAAIINIGYQGAASSTDGQDYELKVIAAAVVGGASLAGGRGTALGAVLGALVIQMIDEGIVLLGLRQDYNRIILGSVIILAAALDRWQASLRVRG